MAGIAAIVGARPNFVKMAPVIRALREGGHHVVVAHTMQHSDEAMSGSFVRELGITDVDILKAAKGLNRARRIGEMSGNVAAYLSRYKPDCCIVAGDVDSTLAAAMGAKLGGRPTPLVHLESGLRSRNNEMPEELNRRLTDHASDLLLCAHPEGMTNLEDEGLAGKYVGNTMLDSVRVIREESVDRDRGVLKSHALSPNGYLLCTFHRPSLVDDPGRLGALMGSLEVLSARIPVAIVMHPRLEKALGALGRTGTLDMRLFPAMRYSEFLALEANARAVITDSGGVQEETTFLGVPCYTFRSETERPCTAIRGTNIVVGTDHRELEIAVKLELEIGWIRRARQRPAIPLWDGEAGPRAAKEVVSWLSRISGQPVQD